MSQHRVHYEGELDALYRFEQKRLSNCPDDEVERIRCRLAMLRAARKLPQPALYVLSFLVAAQGREFRLLADRIAKDAPAESCSVLRGEFSPES